MWRQLSWWMPVSSVWMPRLHDNNDEHGDNECVRATTWLSFGVIPRKPGIGDKSNWTRNPIGLVYWGWGRWAQFMFANVSQWIVHLWPSFEKRITHWYLKERKLKKKLNQSSSYQKYQISTLTNCGLKRIGTLPFSLYDGSCFANNEHIVLCFDYFDDRQCHRSTEPLFDNFTKLAKSRYSHSIIRMASTDG